MYIVPVSRVLWTVGVYAHWRFNKLSGNYRQSGDRLKMTTAKIVEASVNINTNSPFQDSTWMLYIYKHPKNYFSGSHSSFPLKHMLKICQTDFGPFRVFCVLIIRAKTICKMLANLEEVFKWQNNETYLLAIGQSQWRLHPPCTIINDYWIGHGIKIFSDRCQCYLLMRSWGRRLVAFDFRRYHLMEKCHDFWVISFINSFF